MKNTLLISLVVIFALSMAVTNAMAATTIGTNVSTAGTLTVGVDGTGTDVLFYTDTAGEEMLWDASANQLTIDGADGTTALAVTDGNVALTDGLTVGGTAAITGATTLTGLLTTNGDITMSNGATLVNTDASTLTITEATTALTGALTVSTTAAITGATTLTGLLTTNGDITMSNGATLVNTDASTLTITEATLAVTGNETVSGTLAVTGATTMTGALDLNNKLDVGDTQSGGASNGNIIKKTLQASEDYTGTTAGLMVKNYFADTTPTVSSGEFTGLYVNVKQLAALAGDQSSIISGHNYGSGGDYQSLHAGVWLYGDLVNAIKVSNGTSTNGINFSQQTISGSDIVFSNSETISNASDGVLAVTSPSTTFSGTTTTTGVATFTSYVTADGYRVTNGTPITASGDLTKANLQAASHFNVDMTSGSVDVDLGEDAVLDAADVGRKLTFAVGTAGGTLTVSAGSLVTNVTTVVGSGAAADAAGDFIECLVVATDRISCVSYAQ